VTPAQMIGAGLLLLTVSVIGLIWLLEQGGRGR
jgi:hypothetical protein